MPNTYYAKAVVKGTTTPQFIKVQAGNIPEAKKLIEAQLGPIKHFHNGPIPGNKPPSWFKG